MDSIDSLYWIDYALNLAKASNNVPVGAIIVSNNTIIGQGVNCDSHPLKHAEVNAINDAIERYGRRALYDSTMYCTLEPCSMCASAIRLSKIPFVVFGAYDIYNKQPYRTIFIGGMREDQASSLLTDFFANIRGNLK